MIDYKVCVPLGNRKLCCVSLSLLSDGMQGGGK